MAFWKASDQIAFFIQGVVELKCYLVVGTVLYWEKEYIRQHNICILIVLPYKFDALSLECKHKNLHTHLYYNYYNKKEEKCWFAW